MKKTSKYPERQKIELAELPGFPTTKRVRSKPTQRFTADWLETTTQWIAQLSILILITVAPWWYASVSQTARLFLFSCGTIALGATWVYLLTSYRNQKSMSRTGEARLQSGRIPSLALSVSLGFGLLIIQTMPLSESVSQTLAPHQTELYRQFANPIPGEVAFLTTETDTGDPSISISMDPQETTRYARLLFFALAVMVCSSFFFHSRKTILLLLVFVTINAVAISSWGFVQKTSHDRSEFIQPVRDGVLSFGPFVNKNNAAGFLLMGLACAGGLLAYQYRGRNKGHIDDHQMIGHKPNFRKKFIFNLRLLTSGLDAPRLATIVAVLMITAGIISCTSRGGLIGLLVGAFSAATFYATKYRSFTALVIFGLIAVCTVGLIQFIGIGETASRQFSTLSDADLVNTESRLEHWNENAESIADFAPLGSGIGSYLNVHRMNRQGLEDRVWYFAENQYFQTVLEAGWLGLLLLLIAIVSICVAWNKIAKHPDGKKMLPCLTVLGALLIPSQIFTAIFDFGWFIPANALLLAALCGVLVGYTQRPNPDEDNVDPSGVAKTKRTPHLFACIASLVMFGFGWIYINQTLQEAKVEWITKGQILAATPDSLPINQTQEQIDGLSSLVETTSTAKAWNHLAHLFIHRYRLLTYSIICDALSNGSDRKNEREDIWALTQPAFAIDLKQIDARNFNLPQNDPRIQSTWEAYHRQLLVENFLPAIYCLQQSRIASPLQADVHLLLGQLNLAISDEPNTLGHFTRAVELAPGNPDILFSMGYAALKRDQSDLAYQKFKAYLELKPAELEKVVTVTSSELPLEALIPTLLPENPRIIEQFGIKYGVGSGGEQLKRLAFQRAIELLDAPKDGQNLRTKLRLQRALNDTNSAISTNRCLLELFPNDVDLNVSLADLLLDIGEVKQAMRIYSEYRFRNARAERMHRQLTRSQQLP